MTADILTTLIKLNLALALAIVLVLAARIPARRLFGVRVAYRLWLAAPFAAAVLAPARQISRSLGPYIGEAASISSAMNTAAAATAAPIVAIVPAATALWLAGITVSAVVLIVRHRRFLIQSAAHGVGPAVIGFLRPKVILPADFERRFNLDEQRMVLAHEGQHIATGDVRLNTAVAIVQCLFWFNPLVHVGVFQFRLDQELACDAAVVARFPNARRVYAQAMLKTQIAPAGLTLGCYWPARSSDLLKRRIALLSRAQPSVSRRLAGGLAIAGLSLVVGAGAWAAQPPRTVAAQPTSAVAGPTSVDPHLTRKLGARLVEVVQGGNLPTIRYLVEAGADLDYARLGDGTPLIVAARTGQRNVVGLLLDRGADPNKPVMGDGNPLIVAARQGHLEIVEALIARGADVDAEVPGDETPLIGAAGNGQLGVVKALIAHGAAVNHRAWADLGELRSPLGQARKHGHDEVAAYLRDHGAHS